MTHPSLPTNACQSGTHSRPASSLARRPSGLACWRALAGAHSGSIVVETAIALPIFLTIVFGVLEFSIILFTFCNATFACRQAARYASLHSNSSLSPATTSQIKAIVTSDLFLSASLTPTVNVSYLTTALQVGTNTVGNVVLVSANWSQTLLIPFTTSKSISVGSQDIRLITR